MTPARILIAEDYEDNRELLRCILETAGYEVREARDGHECVAAAHAEPFDLALVDLAMPELDGWGVIDALRADGHRQLPCVAITAYAAEPDRARALAAGFDAYISKPYRAQELLALVARLLTERGGVRPPEGSTHDQTGQASD